MDRIIPKKFIPTPFQYHEQVELTISTLSNDGRGIGRINNWIVMVPFVIPGEKVRVSIFKNHKNYSEADLIEILEASPKRIQAPCPFFGQCGGCQYQHIDYTEQLKWKHQQVMDCFERIGKFKITPQELVPSEKIYGYRTKLTPHFERRNHQCPIGFLREGSRRLVDIPQCLIADDAINEVLPEIRKKTQQSNMRHGTLLLRKTKEGVVSDFNTICETIVHGLNFKFPAGSFFQNNPYILKEIISFLETYLQKYPQIKYVVDTYCGVGVFCLALAKHVQQFLGIEIDEKSISLAINNAKNNNIDNGQFIAGNAPTIFESVEFSAENTWVIMDPPRKGATDDFIQQLIAFSPKLIAYISCAPDTQARDLNHLTSLAPQYKLIEVQPFDMFPQTKHMECVAILER